MVGLEDFLYKTFHTGTCRISKRLQFLSASKYDCAAYLILRTLPITLKYPLKQEEEITSHNHSRYEATDTSDRLLPTGPRSAMSCPQETISPVASRSLHHNCRTSNQGIGIQQHTTRPQTAIKGPTSRPRASHPQHCLEDSYGPKMILYSPCPPVREVGPE